MARHLDSTRHCEEHRDEAIQWASETGLDCFTRLRRVRNDGLGPVLEGSI